MGGRRGGLCSVPEIIRVHVERSKHLCQGHEPSVSENDDFVGLFSEFAFDEPKEVLGVHARRMVNVVVHFANVVEISRVFGKVFEVFFHLCVFMSTTFIRNGKKNNGNKKQEKKCSTSMRHTLLLLTFHLSVSGFPGFRVRVLGLGIRN